MIESRHVSFEMPSGVNELIAVEIDKVIDSFFEDCSFSLWTSKGDPSDIEVRVLGDSMVELEARSSLNKMVEEFIFIQKQSIDGKVVSTDPSGLRSMASVFRRLADELDQAASLR